MALIQFNIGEVTKAIEARIEDTLEVVGNEAVAWSNDCLRSNGSVVSGNLLHSVTYSTDRTQGPVGADIKHLSPSAPGANLGLSDTKLAVHIGSNVIYAARVEFGFTGKDSLGRYYNQPAKSYLRAGILAHKATILKRFEDAVRG